MSETPSYSRGLRFLCARCRQAKPAVEFDITVSHSGDIWRWDACAPCRKQADDLRKQRIQAMLKERAENERKMQTKDPRKAKPASASGKHSSEISLAC